MNYFDNSQPTTGQGQFQFETYRPQSVQAPPDQPAPVQPVYTQLTADQRPEHRGLLENDVLLTDGRVVSVMETDPAHDERVERLLGQCGYRLDGLGSIGYQRMMALCAIESVGRLNQQTGEVEGRQDVPVPLTKLMLEERKALPGTTKNAYRIINKYNDVNGLGGDEADPFRG